MDRRRSKELATLLGLSVAIVGLCALLGVWSPLKGDDAYFHLANARFIRDGWPHIWWFPYSHAGEATLTTYPFSYYGIVAVLSRLEISMKAAMQVTLVGSFLLSVISLYLFARSFLLGRLLAVGASLSFFAAPAVWNFSLVGGAYIRAAALPFFFLSVAFAYLHVRRVDEGGDARRPHVASVVSLVLCALLHPFVFQFTVAIVTSIYLVGLKGWVTRLRVLVSVLLPVGAAVAWQYVSIVTAFFGRDQTVMRSGRHDVTGLSADALFMLPRAGEFITGLGPYLFALGLIGLTYVACFGREDDGMSSRRLPARLLFVLGAWSLYFVAMAWLPLAPGLYLMARYDYVFWASLTLMIAVVPLLELAAARWSGAVIRLSAVILAVTVATIAAMAPWITGAATNADPDQPGTYSFAAARAVRVAREESSRSYRLGAVSRPFTRWLAYEYPSLEFLGGRSSVSPHRYFYEWMIDESFYRLDDPRRAYFEDRPKVRRIGMGEAQNYYRAVYWLDWYGSRTALLDVPFTPLGDTADGYRRRPQLGGYTTVSTKYGGIGLATVPRAEPIALQTTSPAVAVPFVGESTSSKYYKDVLELLSQLNLGAGYVIPVALPDGADLQRFDAALVSHGTYVKNHQPLDGFVRAGGRLVITDHPNGELQHRTGDLQGFSSARSPLIPKPLRGVASAGKQPVVGCRSRGAGRRCAFGLSVGGQGEAGFGASLLLLKLLGVPVPTSVHHAEEWDLERPVGNVSGTAKASSSASIGEDGRPKNSIRFGFSLDRPVSLRARGYMTVRIKSKGDVGVVASVVVRTMDGGTRFSYVERLLGSPVGYLTFPLAALVTDGRSKGHRWRSGAITLRSSTSDEVSVSKDDLSVVVVEDPADAARVSSRWRDPTRFEVKVDERLSPSGLLWKENYSSSWSVSADGSRRRHYQAGPGMMWVPLKDDTRTVSFRMPPQETFAWGLAVSVALAGVWATALVAGVTRRAPREQRSRRDP
ncbi:MAG: hypothetical protein ABR529_07400 [Actinomycetota bacterium]